MRINLDALAFVDHIITTSTSDSECVSVAEEQMPNPKRRTTYDSGLCLHRAERENLRISMRIDLQVLSSFDFIP